MEGLIAYAVQQGHLSPLYIQPLLVKGENCLAPLRTASPKRGKTFNLTGHSSSLLPQSLPDATGSDVFSQALTGFLLIGPLVTQLSETLGLANLGRDPPGHVSVPQVPRLSELRLYPHGDTCPFIPSVIQQLFTGHLLLTDAGPVNKTCQSSALVNFSLEGRESPCTNKPAKHFIYYMMKGAVEGKNLGAGRRWTQTHKRKRTWF